MEYGVAEQVSPDEVGLSRFRLQTEFLQEHYTPITLTYGQFE
jgi:hypothetical protein